MSYLEATMNIAWLFFNPIQIKLHIDENYINKLLLNLLENEFYIVFNWIYQQQKLILRTNSGKLIKPSVCINFYIQQKFHTRVF